MNSGIGRKISGGERKLRIGLLMNGFSVPVWTYTMLRRIAESQFATISLVILRSEENKELSVQRPNPAKAPAQSPKSRPLLGKALRALGIYDLSWKIISGIRNKFGRCRQLMFGWGYGLPEGSAPEPNAFEVVDARSLLADVRVMQVVPIRTKFSDKFEEVDLSEIRKHELDVLVRVGFRILRGGILRASRFGVWSYHYGDPDRYRGGPPATWEVIERCPVTGSILQILGEDLDDGIVLYRSFSSTNMRSIAANRNAMYWKTASFLPRKLEELHRDGEDAFLGRLRDENHHINFYSWRMYTHPDARQINSFVNEDRRRREATHRLSKSTFRQWILLYDVGRESASTSLWRFKRLMPPEDRYWADPFVLQRDGKYYVFFEEYLNKVSKGHISLQVMNEKGPCGPVQVVLERPYHLSYPSVFEHDGEVFMIPESRENRTIELYRCVEFPLRWELYRTLMQDVDAVDATLHKSEDMWWMFVSMVENRGASSCDELFLFYAPDPINGPWLPHRRNPVVSDVRRARPAGRLFFDGGTLYRPAQDDSIQYGYGIRISEVLKLTQSEYEEREVTFIEPKWAPDLLGVHTINRSGFFTIADAEIRRPRK
jgi:hypothetical protein